MTRYDPSQHHRRSIRLPGYDYRSPGTYFVTICVQGRECLLGDVVDGQMYLSDLGRVVRHYWLRIPLHFGHVQLDEWVVMPNHLHGIVIIVERGEASVGRSSVRADARDAGGLTTGRDSAGDASPVLSGSLGAIVGNFKSVTTRRINRLRGTTGVRLWQRNYWEHVVRREASLGRIRRYIRQNPARWSEDELHPLA